VTAGFLIAAAATRVLAGFLFQISPVDPLTYVAVGAALSVAALMASCVPAQRAATLDPIDALCAE